MNVFWVNKRKFLLLCLAFASALFILLSYSYIPRNFLGLFYRKDSIYCYRMKAESLPDISDADPEKGKSIFFHETSCNSFINGKISMSARQACAVESAAKLNPNMNVYLLFTSPGVIKLEGDESDRILSALMTYGNVKIMHLDYERYTKGTPVEKLYQSGAVEDSDYAQSHASDVLRYVTLWKYGGVYLDLDVVVIKSLENLEPNFAGAESDDNVAAGVLGFSHVDQGHKFANDCLHDLKDHFNGHDWGYNGPGVITRLLRSICGAKRAKEMIDKDCQGFKVYPRRYFYAIPWWDWALFFKEAIGESVVRNITKTSYVAHVWNKHSTNTKLLKTSKAAYMELARKFCPRVVNECNEVF